MAASGEPYVDPQTLGDLDLQVYEAIMTLEYLGRQPTRSAIGAVTGLDDAQLSKLLRTLTRRRLLVRIAGAAEPVFEPAQRGWGGVPAR
ncbi:MAG: hypothetical protein ACRDNZ_16430 [Streptosporangiaceae bacterium]